MLVGNLWPCLPRRRARLNGEYVVEINRAQLGQSTLFEDRGFQLFYSQPVALSRATGSTTNYSLCFLLMAAFGLSTLDISDEKSDCVPFQAQFHRVYLHM